MISVVVPVYNEERSIPLLADEIADACEDARLRYEILFVDDGSRDQTWRQIKLLSLNSPSIRGIRLARNFGKACALRAGFAAAFGDIIVQMDGDLQDDPNDIPKFIDAIAAGADFACGFKRHRQDRWSRVLGSRLYNQLLRYVSRVELNDQNCGFKAYRAELVRDLPLYGDQHRFIPILLDAQGATYREVEVHHRKRPFGQSRYGSGRILRGLLDVLTVKFLMSFRQRPLHFLGTIALPFILFGLGGLAYLAIGWFRGSFIGSRPMLLYASAALILGIQLLATGLIGELLSYYLNRQGEDYLVRETLRPNRQDETASAGLAHSSTLPTPIRADN